MKCENGFKVTMNLNDKRKKEMTEMKNRATPDLSLDHGVLCDQCFSENDFQSQYEEECPVNYSLKYSETESCKASKTDESKKSNFKEFSDYSNIVQPTNFSLKYREKDLEDKTIKDSDYSFYENESTKFKEYPDYAETDLDQPTDFTLKYGESSDEEVKQESFSYYEAEKSKSSNCYDEPGGPEEVSNVQVPEHYVCQDETPLMFSRCSSLNSLSSFEHITQSIPDDRSSVVSDFSRTTSGIISPSELPDSPTQTAPSSPKRNKLVCFSINRDLRQKKSVFEDDVTTYKQEDTPIEFSRATSLSSLNIDIPIKAEFNLKTNSSASSLVGVDETKLKESNVLNSSQSLQSESKTSSILLKSNDEKDYETKVKFADAEVNHSLIDGIRSLKIKNSGCETTNDSVSEHVSLTTSERGQHATPEAGFKIKSEIRPIFPNPAFEASDDDVHTYHTEGTPANISHAGSHSDLSTLSMISGILPSEAEDNFDDDIVCLNSELLTKCNESNEKLISREIESSVEISNNKTSALESQTKNSDLNESTYFKNQPQYDCIKKKNITHSSQTNISIPPSSNDLCSYAVSFSSLSLSSVNSSANFNRPEFPTVQSKTIMLSSQRNSLLSSDLISVRGDLKNEENERKGFDYISKNQNSEGNLCEVKGIFDSREIPCVASDDPKLIISSSENTLGLEINPDLSIDTWCSESCTPLEDVLVEQCIRLGMPRKTSNKKPTTSGLKFLDSGTPEIWYPKSCTPLQEALVEQCIRLGMPQKNKRLDKNNLVISNEKKIFREKQQPLQQSSLISSKHFNSKFINNEGRYNHSGLQSLPCGFNIQANFSSSPYNTEAVSRSQSSNSLNRDFWHNDLCTPFEEALVEQCIKLGMPRKNNLKNTETFNLKHLVNSEEHNKNMPTASITSRSKSSFEKESHHRESQKKTERFICNSGRKHATRRKKSKETCKKCKKCRDKIKVGHFK